MPRHRGIYERDRIEPYELSRSRIENFVRCPACFLDTYKDWFRIRIPARGLSVQRKYEKNSEEDHNDPTTSLHY